MSSELEQFLREEQLFGDRIKAAVVRFAVSPWVVWVLAKIPWMGSISQRLRNPGKKSIPDSPVNTNKQRSQPWVWCEMVFVHPRYGWYPPKGWLPLVSLESNHSHGYPHKQMETRLDWWLDMSWCLRVNGNLKPHLRSTFANKSHQLKG